MSYRILMVENDADDRYLTEEMFQSEGLDAKVDFIYSNALQDYLADAGHQPQLIILDINTQPHEFTDLVTGIRQTDRYRLTPLIVLGNTARPEDIRKSYRSGANSYIKKPEGYADTMFKINAFIKYWFQAVELPG